MSDNPVPRLLTPPQREETLQRQGRLNNDQVNFINTLSGAALGLAGYWVMTGLPGLLNQWGRGLQSLLNMLV